VLIRGFKIGIRLQSQNVLLAFAAYL